MLFCNLSIYIMTWKAQTEIQIVQKARNFTSAICLPVVLLFFHTLYTHPFCRHRPSSDENAAGEKNFFLQVENLFIPYGLNFAF